MLHRFKKLRGIHLLGHRSCDVMVQQYYAEAIPSVKSTTEDTYSPKQYNIDMKLMEAQARTNPYDNIYDISLSHPLEHVRE